MIKVKVAKFLKNFKKNKKFFVRVFFLIIVSFFLGAYSHKLIIEKYFSQSLILGSKTGEPNLEAIQEKVLPSKGYVFTLRWGDLGKRMATDGVIDEVKLAKAVAGQDQLPAELKRYVDDSNQTRIELNQQNAQFWVDVLWGLGLANKNKILDEGPMVEGGQTANFASTGGYSLGKGGPMDYYSKFSYITLSENQQKQVSEIANNIYRPCCGNSTAFPDCNHGMAALGLITLMVSQNFSQDEIYKTVLAFNSYWFPQTYLDIAYHFVKNGRDYTKVSASEILSKTFSSAMGYQAIKKQLGDVSWPALQRGGSCGA